MRAGVVVVAVMVVVGACGSPGPTGTPGAATVVPATQPAATSTATSTPAPTLSPAYSTIATSEPAATPTAGTTTTPSTEPTMTPGRPPPPLTITSDDGMLTIEIPGGALSQPADITLTELHDLTTTTLGTFGYALKPDGLTFNEPVTISRRMSALDWDEPLPVITLASLDGDQWEYLADQRIERDLTSGAAYISATTTHFSDIYGVSNHWIQSAQTSQPNFVAPVGEDFFLGASVYSDLDGSPLDLTGVEPLMDPRGNVVLKNIDFFGTTFRSNFHCNAAGEGVVGASFGSKQIPNNPDDLTGVNVEFVLFGMYTCLAHSPTPAFQSACLSMVDQPLGDYPRRISGDFAFDNDVRERDIAAFRFAMPEANRGAPVEAEHVFATTWQAVLGFVARRDTVGPWQISVAEIETPDGVVHNILPAVTESIGTIPRNFGPGDSVGDLCGGFGDPF